MLFRSDNRASLALNGDFLSRDAHTGSSLEYLLPSQFPSEGYLPVEDAFVDTQPCVAILLLEGFFSWVQKRKTVFGFSFHVLPASSCPWQR